MKTKNILTLGILSVTFVMTGCKESFLEVEPKTKASLEEYFSTKDHIFEAVVASYSPSHTYDYNGDDYNPLNIDSEVMGDNFWAGGETKTDYQYWHMMENYQATSMFTLPVVWTESYKGIKLTNDVLYYLESAKEMGTITDADYDIFKEEARVLRAWYYNNVWKFFGNIPFFFTNLSAPYLGEQMEADVVYENVIADLEEAVKTNKLPMQWDDENIGRVTQAMAYMLYAEMVMYQNDNTRYATALSYMESIINDQTYGFDLVGNYADLWTSNGEWGVESIWEINYTDGPLGKRAYTGGEANVGGTWLPKIISPAALDGEEMDEGHEFGWGAAPLRVEAYNKFEDGDARREATCYFPTEGKYKPRYQNTGIFLNKYTALSENIQNPAGAPDINFNNNYRVYRFAETLLNAAELLVRTSGDLAQAKRYLERVHKRATGTNVSIQPTIENIIHERDLEFMGEGKRYWDLVRTGMAPTVLVPDADGYRTNTWSASKKYLPIPQSDISAAQGTLKQNNY